MLPQLRNAENYYEAQDRYHADMMVKSLGFDQAVKKCCEEQWLNILHYVRQYGNVANSE